MTHKAREVLADCRLALRLLEEEQELQRWRILWAAGVALVRAVGHVLDKVDGQDPAIRKAANQQYELWKEAAPNGLIFREFIEKERNNLLKEYQFNVHPSPEVPIVVQAAHKSAEGDKPTVSEEVFDLGNNLFRPMTDGEYGGEDARDVLSEAIEWWEKQLDLIDKIVTESHKSKS